MERRQWTMAAAIAMLMMATVGPVTPVQALTGGPACSETDDDAGFGGSDVECQYECSRGDALLIEGQAHDADATVAGHSYCGDAAVTCGPGNLPRCEGQSPDVTTEGGNGHCEAQTDEFWSSPVTVACEARGVTPPPPGEEPICVTGTDICIKPTDPKVPVTIDDLQQLAQEIVDALPPTPTVEELRRLIEALGPEIEPEPLFEAIARELERLPDTKDLRDILVRLLDVGRLDVLASGLLASTDAKWSEYIVSGPGGVLGLTCTYGACVVAAVTCTFDETTRCFVE